MVMEQPGQPDIAAQETEVDLDQASLDADQGEPQGPQFMTRDEVQALLDQQRRTYEMQVTAASRQISGLQSKVDTGLNAIRRDYEQALQAERESLLRRQQFEASMAELSEEQQRPMRHLFDQQEQALNARTPAPTTTPADTGPSVDEQAAWQQVYQFVQAFGLDYNDRRIDYAILTDQSKDENTRRSAFVQQLRGLMATPTPPAAPPPARTNNPPVESASRSPSGYRNIDDLRDAFISGRLEKDDFLDRATKLGFPSG